jgi:hypothetical protein
LHSPVSVLLADGTVPVAGGARTVEVYDPAAGTFTIADGETDFTRWYPTATLLPGGDVLIGGGYDNDSTCTRRAWLYHPDGPSGPGTRPRPRPE